MLSQDAEPENEDWLERMLEGFGLAPDVAIVYGPYRRARTPRPRCASSSSGGSHRSRPTVGRSLERLAPTERGLGRSR